jgi:hypothetical protein
MGLHARVALIAPLLPLLFACGYGRSQDLDDPDSGGVPPDGASLDSASLDAPSLPDAPPPLDAPSPSPTEDGGTCVSGLDIGCIDPCGDPVPPSCVDGVWQCPDYGLGGLCQGEDAGG